MVEIEFPIYALTGLFESTKIPTGTRREVPGSAIIELGPMPVEQRDNRFAYDAAPILTMFVHIGSDVAVGLFTAWLYDKLKTAKVRRIKINRRSIEVTPEGILKAVEESIEVGEQ